MTDKSWNLSEMEMLAPSREAEETKPAKGQGETILPVVRRLPHPPGIEKKNWFDKLEAFVSGLSVRDTFWHRICSFLWLPLAFFSGIQTRQLSFDTFTAVLPFRR